MKLGRRGLTFVAVGGLAVACGGGGDNGSPFAPPPQQLDQAPAPDDPGNSFGAPTGDDGGPTGPTGPVCGNSVVDTGEQCDDGNATPNDGCSATCQIEPGYQCPTLGAACVAAACGDGVVAGDEDCDDGNSKGGDGCSAVCVLEAGYKCPAAGKACVPTVCGDGKKEGTEQCDDGNLRPYDGCSPTCAIEPKCAGGTCTAVCGDGVKFPGEDCDDGNTRSGDGCSATCKLEAGFTCQVVTADLPATLSIPIIYRDFTPDTNPDFEKFSGSSATTGLVKDALGANGFPQFLSTTGSGQYGQQITSATSYAAWWTDDAAKTTEYTIFNQTLPFTKQTGNVYQYDNQAFFPIDGEGFGNYASTGHNFSFTSELRYQFTFQGGEALDFIGDDDVWVFINGKLAVDLGGLHPATEGSITLDTAHATTLGLTAGGMYEFDVFQAERHTSESHYRLTLGGFVKQETSCAPICGDGIKTKNEACDDGTNTGGYGKCGPGCVLGPRCGDGTVQADQGEQCDDGNLVSGDGCSSTCQTEGSGTH